MPSFRSLSTCTHEPRCALLHHCHWCLFTHQRADLLSHNILNLHNHSVETLAVIYIFTFGSFTQNGSIAKLTNAVDAAKAHAQKMQRDVNREITPSVQAQMVGPEGCAALMHARSWDSAIAA